MFYQKYVPGLFTLPLYTNIRNVPKGSLVTSSVAHTNPKIELVPEPSAFEVELAI